MADYTDLMPDILPHVMSCPTPIILRTLRKVARDFFQRSEAYTYQIPSAAVTQGVNNVQVSLPAGTELAVPLTMFLDGERLSTTNHEILALDYGDWKAQSGTPTFVMVDDNNGDELVLALTPDAAYTLTGRVAIKPSPAATELDDTQFDRHSDALVDGVLARLMMMKNTEWYDAGLARYYEVQFEAAIDEAHDVSNKGNTSRVLGTTYGGL